MRTNAKEVSQVNTYGLNRNTRTNNAYVSGKKEGETGEGCAFLEVLQIPLFHSTRLSSNGQPDSKQ